MPARTFRPMPTAGLPPLGRVVVDWLNARQMRLTDLATRAGGSAAWLSRVVHGVGEPEVPRLRALEEAMALPRGDLLVLAYPELAELRRARETVSPVLALAGEVQVEREFQLATGEIVRAVTDGTLTPAEGEQLLEELADDLQHARRRRERVIQRRLAERRAAPAAAQPPARPGGLSEASAGGSA